MKYVYYTPDGEIIKVSNQKDVATVFAQDSSLVLEVDDYFDITTSYVADGVIQQLPPRPEPYMTFNYQTKVWRDARSDLEAALDVKLRRGDLLKNSDWTQITNSPLSTEKQQAWATYRQELRDIPQQSGYPLAVIWPTPPQ